MPIMLDFKNKDCQSCQVNDQLKQLTHTYTQAKQKKKKRNQIMIINHKSIIIEIVPQTNSSFTRSQHT